MQVKYLRYYLDGTSPFRRLDLILLKVHLQQITDKRVLMFIRLGYEWDNGNIFLDKKIVNQEIINIILPNYIGLGRDSKRGSIKRLLTN